MVNFLSSLLLALIVLIIVLIATFAVTLGFLFVGGVLADWFSLTRLEATGVALVVGILLTYLVVRVMEIPISFAPGSDEGEENGEERLRLGRSRRRKTQRKQE